MNSDNILGKFKKVWQEKCKNYDYLPSILPPANRIIVIGDVHGDYEQVINCLKVGRVIDDKEEWIGDDTIVVQVGDQVDSCRQTGFCHLPQTTGDDKPDDIKILKFFTNLHKKAQKDGGAVYSILGNHELMNVQGDMSYVSYKNVLGNRNEFDKNYFKALDNRRKAFKPGNKYANFLACTRKMVLIIGSNLFVHAGIVPEMVEKYPNIDNLNSLLALYLLDELETPHNFNDIFMSAQYSPLWNRVFGNVNNSLDKCRNLMQPLNDVYKVGKIYVGHTPQVTSGIKGKCENKIWLVDNGVSKAFNNLDYDYLATGTRSSSRQAQVLEILNDNEINILK